MDSYTQIELLQAENEDLKKHIAELKAVLVRELMKPTVADIQTEIDKRDKVIAELKDVIAKTGVCNG